jgi:phosphate transport system protein
MSDVRKTYSQELEHLQQLLLEMGAMTEELIKNSIKALIEKDAALAEKTIAADDAVDEKEAEIDNLCLKLLALQQPMAGDLRFIGSVLKIVTDVERLSDHTTKISKKALILSGLPQLKPYVDLPEMASRVIEMFKLSLDAFVRHDVAMAYKIIDMDSAIDDYNHKIFRELVELMIKDPSCINYVTHLMVVVQSLERIADHVTNICERIIFIATGDLPKLN